MEQTVSEMMARNSLILDLYDRTETPYKYMAELNNDVEAAVAYDLTMLSIAYSRGLITAKEHLALTRHLTGDYTVITGV